MYLVFLASLLTGIILAPLGCVVLWKRYAYFTDGFAHASTLAAVIACSYTLPVIYAWVFVSIIFVLLIQLLRKYSDANSSISLVTSLFLALSVLFSQEHTHMSNILFGKISDVGLDHIVWLSITLLINIIFFIFFYKKILIISLSYEIAHSLKISVRLIEILFLVLLALSIVITSRAVGAFFVINLILIPALIARIISRSPVFMICNAIIWSIIPNVILFLLSLITISIQEKLSALLIIINVICYLSIIFMRKICVKLLGKTL